jgi:hypothetical protein
MKNKKGFELSVNFLVTMIIMVVIFGFGIYLFATIFNRATEIDDNVRQQEMDRLNMLLDDGSLVSVLNPQQAFKGDALRFAIGITNIQGQGNDEFKVVINNNDCQFTPNDGGAQNCNDYSDHFSVPSDFTSGFNIRNNEKVHRLMLFTGGSPNGIYRLKFQVQRKNSENSFVDYGSPQMIWVTT